MHMFKIAWTKKLKTRLLIKFDVDLKLIEEWIQKPIEQIDASLKVGVGIKELNEMVSNDLKYADYKKRATTPDHESENNDMDVSEDKDECIGTIFQQWSQVEIRLYYQELWQKESQEYEA